MDPSCIPNAIALKSLQIEKQVKFYKVYPILPTNIDFLGSKKIFYR